MSETMERAVHYFIHSKTSPLAATPQYPGYLSKLSLQFRFCLNSVQLRTTLLRISEAISLASMISILRALKFEARRWLSHPFLTLKRDNGCVPERCRLAASPQPPRIYIRIHQRHTLRPQAPFGPIGITYPDAFLLRAPSPARPLPSGSPASSRNLAATPRSAGSCIEFIAVLEYNRTSKLSVNDFTSIDLQTPARFETLLELEQSTVWPSNLAWWTTPMYSFNRSRLEWALISGPASELTSWTDSERVINFNFDNLRISSPALKCNSDFDS
ncbi:hypothetical protein B0H15DRAFT_946224 [Mycena belliarum]|uniref:Uncharacterized protein n=1 Tax=Mycena belliarum TaxID=1033014 RepID=A0AAD6UC61_9AGAR|nr:hypothetical protein B0H15DRAFT_946224 [Mycena belliae]